MRIILLVSLIVFFGSVSVFAEGCHNGKTSGHEMNAAAGSHQHSAALHDSAASAKKEIAAQTKCPVMGGKVDREVFTVWEGNEDYSAKKVYFCCPGCIDTFKKDPVKYIKKLEKMGQPIESVSSKKTVDSIKTN